LKRQEHQRKGRAEQKGKKKKQRTLKNLISRKRKEGSRGRDNKHSSSSSVEEE
jgi:hypothetical protein